MTTHDAAKSLRRLRELIVQMQRDAVSGNGTDSDRIKAIVECRAALIALDELITDEENRTPVDRSP